MDWIPILKLSAELSSAINIAYTKIVRKTRLKLRNSICTRIPFSPKLTPTFAYNPLLQSLV